MGLACVRWNTGRRGVHELGCLFELKESLGEPPILEIDNGVVVEVDSFDSHGGRIRSSCRSRGWCMSLFEWACLNNEQLVFAREHQGREHEVKPFCDFFLRDVVGFFLFPF